MPIASRAARFARLVAQLAVCVLRTFALLLLLAIALFLPAPILGRPRFEPPERRNKVTETRPHR